MILGVKTHFNPMAIGVKPMSSSILHTDSVDGKSLTRFVSELRLVDDWISESCFIAHGLILGLWVRSFGCRS